MSERRHEAGEVVLRLQGITKRFGALTANSDINLTLRQGEVLALLGENGAGKTTLMNILFGHYVADEGRVEVFGRPLPPGNPRAALAAGIELEIAGIAARWVELPPRRGGKGAVA